MIPDFIDKDRFILEDEGYDPFLLIDLFCISGIRIRRADADLIGTVRKMWPGRYVFLQNHRKNVYNGRMIIV